MVTLGKHIGAHGILAMLSSQSGLFSGLDFRYIRSLRAFCSVPILSGTLTLGWAMNALATAVSSAVWATVNNFKKDRRNKNCQSFGFFFLRERDLNSTWITALLRTVRQRIHTEDLLISWFMYPMLGVFTIWLLIFFFSSSQIRWQCHLVCTVHKHISLAAGTDPRERLPNREIVRNSGSVELREYVTVSYSSERPSQHRKLTTRFIF